VGSLSFEEMIEFLAQHAQDREPSNVDMALRRTAVERELMIALGATPPVAERRAFVRVPGRLPMRLHVGSSVTNATVQDLGEGGVRITAVMAPPIGGLVDVELLPTAALSDLHPPRAEAMVVWARQIENHGYDLGLRFTDDTEAHRRRFRRIVIELLRKVPL
jgi:hypothetical protein